MRVSRLTQKVKKCITSQESPCSVCCHRVCQNGGFPMCYTAETSTILHFGDPNGILSRLQRCNKSASRDCEIMYLDNFGAGEVVGRLQAGWPRSVAVALLVLGVVLRVLAAMPPKPKVSESGDIGHDITFEVRPQKKGSPTVHVDVAGTRLPAFRLKDGKPVDEQVRSLGRRAYCSGNSEHIAGETSTGNRRVFSSISVAAAATAAANSTARVAAAAAAMWT